MMDVRRHWWGYSFRAWIDGRGSNSDRKHNQYCCCRNPHGHTHTCWHYRLWDFNRPSSSKNILRIVHRRRPFYFGVFVGSQCWRLIHLERKVL